MITRAYPPRIGGTGSLVQAISRELVKEFEVTIITQRIKGAKRFETSNGIEIHRTFNLSDSDEFNFWNMGISMPVMTGQILRHSKADVFHSHDISFAGFSACAAKQFLKKKPFILKYGGDLVFEYLSLKNFKNWNPGLGLDGTLNYDKGAAKFLHKIQNWYFNSYDLICPDSLYGKNFLLKKNVPKNKIQYLPNAINTEEFKPMSKKHCRKRLGLNELDTVIVSVARLVPWKGHDTAIKALKEIKKENKRIKLIIIGSGPDKQRLVGLSKKYSVEKEVIFAGNVSRNKMPLYLNACDVFVLLSSFDTCPNALLEAMACKKACIVSNIKGVTEVTGDSALKINFGDFEGLSDSMKKLIADEKLRQKLGKKAYELIRERFTIKKIAKEYAKLYLSLR